LTFVERLWHHINGMKPVGVHLFGVARDEGEWNAEFLAKDRCDVHSSEAVAQSDINQSGVASGVSRQRDGRTLGIRNADDTMMERFDRCFDVKGDEGFVFNDNNVHSFAPDKRDGTFPNTKCSVRQAIKFTSSSAARLARSGRSMN